METFAPPTMATRGRRGASSAFESAAISASNSGPAHATGACLATPWVEAWARWAVAKASLTYTSHRLASRRASPASFVVSPGMKRMFSNMTNAPGCAVRPSPQSAIRGVSRPNKAESLSATGAREQLSS